MLFVPYLCLVLLFMFSAKIYKIFRVQDSWFATKFGTPVQGDADNSLENIWGIY